MFVIFVVNAYLMKKSFIYTVFVFLFLSFIGMMGFGAIVKYHYESGKKFEFLQKTVMLIVEVPFNVKTMIKNKTLNLNELIPLSKHKDKKRFLQFVEKKKKCSFSVT